jgi:hypothetical protein
MDRCRVPQIVPQPEDMVFKPRRSYQVRYRQFRVAGKDCLVVIVKDIADAVAIIQEEVLVSPGMKKYIISGHEKYRT